MRQHCHLGFYTVQLGFLLFFVFLFLLEAVSQSTERKYLIKWSSTGKLIYFSVRIWKVSQNTSKKNELWITFLPPSFPSFLSMWDWSRFYPRLWSIFWLLEWIHIKLDMSSINKSLEEIQGTAESLGVIESHE